MLLFTLMSIFVIFPAVGLAIDAGILFAIKAKLQSATDGAALAAGRSLSRELALSDQEDTAVETAQRYFNANLSDHWLGLSTPNIDVTFPTAPPKTTIIDVQTSVVAPTYFMRILGWTDVTVRAGGASTRRDVNIIMVLDRSTSLSVPSSTPCVAMRGAAASFIDAFVESRDRIGVVTFGTSYGTEFAPSYNFKSGGTNALTVVNSITCNGYTNAAGGYIKGIKELEAINEPGTLNVLLFFTDGDPTAIDVKSIPMKTGAYCTNTSNRTGVFRVPPAATSMQGIYKGQDNNNPPANEGDIITNNSGCRFRTNQSNVGSDVQYLSVSGSDEADALGNFSLVHSYSPPTRSSGKITLNPSNINKVATNALLNAAEQTRISNPGGLDILTYVIGLGAVDADLLNRVANTSASPTYDDTLPVGILVLATNEAELQQAFAQLASDILRLSM
jgi:Flp pilus assembly protein TadG